MTWNSKMMNKMKMMSFTILIKCHKVIKMRMLTRVKLLPIYLMTNLSRLKDYLAG